VGPGRGLRWMAKKENALQKTQVRVHRPFRKPKVWIGEEPTREGEKQKDIVRQDHLGAKIKMCSYQEASIWLRIGVWGKVRREPKKKGVNT